MRRERWSQCPRTAGDAGSVATICKLTSALAMDGIPKSASAIMTRGRARPKAGSDANVRMSMDDCVVIQS